MDDGKNRTGGLRYSEAGVDIEAGNRLVDLIKPAVAGTRRAGADGTIGGFGGVFDLKAAGYRDPLLVSATDGVGTKLRIAIETGRLDTIGVDLVAMCVNDLIVQGAEPLFFLDYYATGKLNPEQAAAVVSGIAEGCRIAGCALVGGETAEMPGLYADGDFDLAGFAVGAVERERLLPRAGIIEGDIILGVASSGVHSNGFSLVRKVVSDAGIGWDDEAPFAAGKSLGEALLTPTRIYVPSMLKVLHESDSIKALAHITGGGLTENLPRVLPDDVGAVVNSRDIALPPVFAWLQSAGGLDADEMRRVFNCGVGMVAIVAAADSDEIAKALNEAGDTAFEIGRIVKRTGSGAVSYSSETERQG